MKRDLSLCRDLLLRLEAQPGGVTGVEHFPLGHEVLTIEGASDEEVSYNLACMLKAGFFAEYSQMDGSGGLIFSGISWAGHEYLDAVRDPDRWRKTREGAKAVGGMTFGLIKDVALAIEKRGQCKARAAPVMISVTR